MALSRRKFFALAGASAAGTVMMSPLQALYARKANGQSVFGKGYGPLIPDPNGLLDLPRDFQYRALSRTGDVMSNNSLVPGGHDGMGAFAGSNGTTILVRNHELSPTSSTKVSDRNAPVYDPLCKGGTTTLIIGKDRKLIRHFPSIQGTFRNCAGGVTPWGSWITSEENTSTPEENPGLVSKRHGYNFEVPANATGAVPPIPLKAMGRFNHEAVAVDPATGIVYETEDRGDGLFYRFIPQKPGNLKAGGILQALAIKGRPSVNTSNNSGITIPVGQTLEVEWVTIDDPDPVSDSAPTGTRFQGKAKGAATFTRGEGIWFGNNELYFICTDGGPFRLGQVWRYVPGQSAQDGGTLTLFVESTDKAELENPDNIVVSPFGDLFVCEDGDDDQFVVGITPAGELYQFARNAINDRELAGACFSPDGQTMFVNIQTPGITFAIWGPWNRA
jgi:secreted PhoX family phosphatase